MAEMKSAFEKALERAGRLGKLSPQEIRERKEDEYAPIGRALADRYLKHGYGKILEEEADKYAGEEKEIVMKAALSRLVEAIELGNYDTTERAVEGILVLTGEEQVGDIGEQIRSLLAEHRQAEENKYQEQRGEIERRERELLHRLRISGSAVGEINLEASETWKELSQELYSQFEQRLDELKGRLLKNVG